MLAFSSRTTARCAHAVRRGEKSPEQLFVRDTHHVVPMVEGAARGRRMRSVRASVKSRDFPPPNERIRSRPKKLVRRDTDLFCAFGDIDSEATASGCRLSVQDGNVLEAATDQSTGEVDLSLNLATRARFSKCTRRWK